MTKQKQLQTVQKVTRNPDGSLVIATQGLTIEINADCTSVTVTKADGTKVTLESKDGEFEFDAKKLGTELFVETGGYKGHKEVLVRTGDAGVFIDMNLEKSQVTLRTVPAAQAINGIAPR